MKFFGKLLYILLFFFVTINTFAQDPTVVITDQNNNTGNIPINCTYNFIPPKRIRLNATYPELNTTTNYTVATIPYAPQGVYTDGTSVALAADDVWSNALPIGFTFCFYGNNYTTINVTDNGIVRFGYNPLTPEGSFSSITNTTPDPSLVRNAIFGGFQDHIVAPVGFGCEVGDFCGSISYLTTGTAPFRKLIVNFNELNHFNCTGFNDKNSTFQVVLYETTNVIEVNVKEKPITCNGNVSANGNANSLIGLNNANGTLGIAPPNRNTGVFDVTTESYRFTPSGATATTINWYNAAGNFLGNSNPIDVIPPPTNTFYTAIVNYNTCVPRQIQSNINVVYDLDYPTAPNITRSFCDVSAPFPNETIDVEALLIDPLDDPLTIKTIHNSQIEADNNINPLLNMNAYNLTTSTQVFYYRETIGACYVTGAITLQLFETPNLSDQEIEVCDTNNDNTETVNLSTLTTQITGYQSWQGYSFYQNLANANLGINPINSVTVTQPPGFYNVFVRVVNNSNTACFDVFQLTIKILPRLQLAPITAACIVDPNFNFQENFNLTTLTTTTSVGPLDPDSVTYSYYSSLTNAQNGTNPIVNPTNYLVSIPQPQINTTIYIGATAPGFCPNYIPVILTFCKPDGGDDGGGGGGGAGGFGGISACLETGDAIPAYDLNVVYSNVMSAIPVIPVPVSVGFYTTLLGAQTQDTTTLLTTAQVAAFTPVAPFSAIWVRFVDANGVPGIKRIIVPVKFKKHEVRNFDICDVFNNGIENVDLDSSPTPISYLAQIQLENPNETVVAYASMVDYLSNNNPITDIDVIGPTTTVYVKVSSFGCDSDYTLNFNLVPFTIRPILNQQVCDIGSDGVENFDLTTLIVPNSVGFINPAITIHSTLNGAYTETNLIPNTTTSFPVNTTTKVWVRIEEDPTILPKTCPTIQEYSFGFFNSIAVNNIAPLEICDIDNDGLVTLNTLNAVVASIVNEIPAEPIIKKLYTDLVSAQTNNPINEILPNWDTHVYSTALFGSTGNVYLYLQNSVTSCIRIVPINIIVQSLPLSTNTSVAYCDFVNDNSEVIANMNVFNSQITSNSVLYSFQYFNSLANASAGSPQIPANYSVQDGDVVYVKIQSGLDSGCSAVVPVEINLNPSPIVNNISPLICDNLGNNTEVVNLISYQNTLVASTVGLTFKYYSSPSDANIDINFFSNFTATNYTIPSFSATNFAAPVYVRIIDNITGCFSIATIVFERRPLIDAFDTIQFTCDISTTNQLQGIFNLNASIPRLGLNGMIANPADYIITFHNTVAQANAGILAITSPNIYTVTANQTSYVYVRFLDSATGCFTVKTLELQIYNLPKFVNSIFDVCDDNLDGIYSVNLTSLNNVVVANPAPFTFQYFNSISDAQSNSNAITNITNYTLLLNQFPKIIYVKGTNVNNCSQIKGVTLEHKPEIPMLSNVVEIIECDPDNNGVEVFNLNDALPLITNTTLSSYRFFTSISDLQADTNAIVNPLNYQNLAPNPSVVYVRLQRPALNCDAWATINLKPFYENYVFPPSISICDNNANGNEPINLQQTVYNLLSTYLPATLNLQFYTSLTDANTGTNVITTPTNYLLTNFTTPIFVKITNISTGCPIIKQLNYVVPSPVVLTPYTTNVCDFNTNNSEDINLSTYFNQLNATPNNYSITSYLTQIDAENNNSAQQISNTNYIQTTPTNTYYIRFQDLNGCHSVSTITVNIIAYPVVLNNPPLLELCDTNGNSDLREDFNITLNENFIRNGNASYVITYHANQTEAQLAQNPITNPIAFNSATGSVWVRIVTAPVSTLISCNVVVEQKLKVIPLPTPNLNPTLIQLCDVNNTGNLQESFNLTTNETFIRNGDTSAIITYHLTPTDAQNGQNAITNPNAYASGTRIVYVRVKSPDTTTLSNCAIVVQQPIEVVPFPVVSINPPLLELCDTNGNRDLREDFNITLNENFIRNGNASYVITYHANQTEAQLAQNPITNPIAFNSATGSVWVRIVTAPVSTLISCNVVVEQKLKVIPLPTPNLNPTLIQLCDVNNTGNLQESFNLTTNETFIRNGDTSAIITYHLTPTDAQNGQNAITSPFNFVSSNASVWIRVQSNTATSLNNCAVVVEQKLEVVPLPTPSINPVALILCDDNNIGDLSETFDLTTNENYIRNNDANALISYHETAAEAQNGQNSIANPSAYNSVSTTVFVRVIASPASSLLTCAVVIPQQLIVNVLPNVYTVTAYYSCINSPSGSATFNLSTKTVEVLGNQNASLFSVSYHSNATDAKLIQNALPNIYNSTATTIWAAIKNNVTQCVNVVSFNLIPETSAIANTPPLSLSTVCDVDLINNGLTQFNLNSFSSSILGSTQTNNFSISYYLSASDLVNNVPITNLTTFENTSNPQQIFVKVINNNTVNRCMTTNSFNLVVNTLPEPILQDGFVCFDQVSGNLVSNFTFDAGLNNVDYTFEWYNGTQLIVNQSNNTLTVNQPGNYFVIATNNNTLCESLPVGATIISSQPAITTVRVEYSFADDIKVIVNATGNGDYTYQIDDLLPQTSNVFSNVVAGTHFITVIDNNGCTPSVIEVVVLDYDKFFTPNGDGYNEKWQIQGIAGQPDAKVFIFDRYGKLLKELTPGSTGWDGMYNGAQLPSTDYWFVVKYRENGENKEFKSHFTLKR